jgi:serine/threonine-protein kinase
MNSFAPGEVFLDKYRIEEVLGQGGMGVVVAARHLELDELVAIKFLHATFATQPEQVERFLREGRAAVKIKSEHVARVRDVGKLENGAPYMIMEHLVGSDLGVVLRNEGRLPVPDAIEIILQACEALAEAHTAGIVHRDLKPANLFLAERADGSPCVKVLDFGISKLLDGTGGALTATNGMMGSPLYMSPEQLHAAKNVDMRADVWALGVMLFELITGDRPFHAETIPQVVMVVTTQPPTKLETLLSDAPRGLSAVLEKCLAKSVNDRYENVGALAKALEPFAPAEALKSIERIMRVVSGTVVRRQRTGRTAPSPDDSQPITPIGTAPTLASTPAPKLEQTNLGGSVQTKPPPDSPRPKPKRAGVFIALGAVAVLAIIVGVFARRSDPATIQAAPIASSPSEVKDVSVTTTSASAEPAATPVTAPSPSASTSSSAPTWIVKAPVTKPTPTVKASASAAKPNCDPPYLLQPDGTKKYKMECL